VKAFVTTSLLTALCADCLKIVATMMIVYAHFDLVVVYFEIAKARAPKNLAVHQSQKVKDLRLCDPLPEITIRRC
jgi:hypothetical protein